MSLGTCFTSDIMPFDQNWHHLYSASTGGTDIFNDAQIRVISSMEPEICIKFSEKCEWKKLRAKLPVITCAYSMVKIAHLNDAFSEVFRLEASPNLKRATNNIDIITMGKVNLSFDKIAIFLLWLPMWGTFRASGQLEEPFPFPHHSFNLSCYPKEPSMDFHLFLWDPLVNSSF